MQFVCLLFFFLATGFVSAQTYHVEIVTNYGNMEIVLYDGTPHHRDNFIRLAQTEYFDSLLFHRVIKGFVIQAGDPDSKYALDTALLGEGDLGYQIPAELFPNKYFHKRGALGMARDDNPRKASSACQFYIVQGKIANDSTFIKARQRTNGFIISDSFQSVYRHVGGIPHLDSRYTVFGEVVKGMSVVDSIAALPTDSNDRPLMPVRIVSTHVSPKPKIIAYADTEKMMQGVWENQEDSNTYMVFNKGKLFNYYRMSDGENVYTTSDYFFSDNCIAEEDKTLSGLTFLIQRFNGSVQCSELKDLSKNSFRLQDAVTGRIFTMQRIKALPKQ